MTLRTAPTFSLLLLCAASFSWSCGGQVTATESADDGFQGPKNVILVVCDTLRADRMSLYGYGRETTPNLDALAETGTVYENASSMSSWTLPSMSMLLTGEMKARADMAILTTHRHVAESFSDAGYHTAAVVGNPILDEVLHYHRGFDHFDVEVGPQMARHADEIVSEGLTWLDSIKGSEEPFFLWLHPTDPHFDFAPEGGPKFPTDREEEAGTNAGAALAAARSRYPGKYPEGEFTPAVWDEITHQRNLYDSEIKQFDESMGRLVDSLKERGLFESTVIVVTSDHGEGLWGRPSLPDHQDRNTDFPALYRSHGLMLHTEQVHVPLFFHGPGVPKGERRDTWIQTTDLVPTLHALCDVPITKALPGEALFEEGSNEKRDALFAVCSRSFSVTVDERWRVHFPREHRLRKMDIDFEVYDLVADPKELAPLDDPERVAAYAELLEEWRQTYSPIDPHTALDPEVWKGLQALGYGGEIEVDTSAYEAAQKKKAAAAAVEASAKK